MLKAENASLPASLLHCCAYDGTSVSMGIHHRTVIHWFRRDLRLTDNTALHHAVHASEFVVPVYVISGWREQHGWTGPNRQQFLCGCLASLEQNLTHAGGRLVFRRGNAAEELQRLIKETGAEAIFTNRDPDPYGIAMEAQVERRCRELGVAFHAFKDSVLHERDEVMTGAGTPFRVFTPYNKVWQSLPKAPLLPAVRKLRTPEGVASQDCPALNTWKLRAGSADIPEPGERAARSRMKEALTTVLPHYKERRNTPHGKTTSRLSTDLRHGTLSIRELYHRAAALLAEGDAGVKLGVQTWLNEIAWREFYMQILWHWPEVLEHEFDPKWRGLPWEYDQAKLCRWQDGLTGFPIVDAGMRELRATGFMHNRVRMITAMFLTKDLHLDWRLGEQFFMQQLTDGEIASNNGGWQWSAGTGADAAPYFRIQNPWSQTKSYDPDGDYIRRWVPELAHVPAAALLSPPLERLAKDYPLPMVDHHSERDHTLAMFKQHAERSGQLR
jgi:deoxyribodipyrimidine photo-lyase